MTHTIANCNTNEPKRRFKGVWIPKDLWLTSELSLTEKFLFLEIDSYVDEEEGYCYATNAHFAKFLQLSKPRVSTAIKSLATKGLIRVESDMNGAELIRRKLFVVKQFGDLEARQGSAPARSFIEADPEKRQFRGVWIPAVIWLNTSLNFTEKAMLAEIDSLQSPTRGCYASNTYFAVQFGITAKWASDVISRLNHSGFVSVTQIRDGLMTVERRVFVENLNATMVTALSEFSGQMKGGQEGVSSNRRTLSSNRTPLQSDRTPPFKKPEHIEAFKEPEIKTHIDTAPGAPVCRYVEVGQVEELVVQGKSLEVNQAEESLVEQQSEGEADPYIDFKAIKDLFNTILGDTSGRIEKLTRSDKQNFFSLNNLEAFKKIKTGAGAGAVVAGAEALFQAVLACPYLTGEHPREWTPDFEWIITPANAKAILEGRYKPKRAAKEMSNKEMLEKIVGDMNDY